MPISIGRATTLPTARLSSAPQPIKLTLREYQAMAGSAKNDVEQGSEIRTVGQFFRNGDFKANEFAAFLARGKTPRGMLRSVPSGSRAAVVDGLVRWNPALKKSLPTSKLQFVALPDARGTMQIVGVMVKARGKTQGDLFGYFPAQGGGMQLQWHASSRPVS